MNIKNLKRLTMTTTHKCPNCGHPLHATWTTTNYGYQDIDCCECHAKLTLKIEAIIENWEENPKQINYGEARE
jgi:transcription elongation factor Elf1